MDQQAWADLARRFASCEIVAAEWTHQAHLAVGAWYLSHYSASEAGQKLRDGIRRLNLSLGGQNTDSSGFHETLTEFWLRVIEAHLAAGKGLDEILTLPSNHWRNFYSLDLPKSRVARLDWVEPDLKPITV